MEFFIWLMIIAICILILIVPLAMMAGGLALIVSAIQKIFNIKL